MVTSLITIIAITLLGGALILVLRAFLPKNHPPTPDKNDCSTDPAVLEAYATDASIFYRRPTRIYFPKDTAGVRDLVKKAHAVRTRGEQVSLTVRAGGTCMSGGPLSDSWVVDLGKHLTSVAINPKDRTATVGAGARFRDIEDAAKKHGLMFAAYPSSHRSCGIGGMLGNNASGEKSLRFGATSDNVLSLEVVLADGSTTIAKNKPRTEADEREGEIIALADEWGATLKEAAGDVKKAASGYRLDKVLGTDNTFSTVPLFVGAQGTLGIITSATLRLVPIPEHVALLAVSARSLDDIAPIVETVYRFNPEALETFDKNTFAKAREHLSVFANTFLPHIDPTAELFILAEFSESAEEATEAKAAACLAALREHKLFVQKVSGEHNINAAWQIRRNSFLLMRDHTAPEHRAVPCIEDVIVPLSVLGTFIHELGDILARHTTEYGFHGHIGDGSLRIIPVFDFSDTEVTKKMYALMRDTFALVKRLRGNISADHSDGIIRTPFLRDFYGAELYEVFTDIKKLYDPENLLNPGKKVGGEIRQIEQSLRR